MIRTALLLCAGLLAAVCFACVQQQQQAVVPPPSPVAARTVDCSSPGNFAASVQMLDASFVPDPDNPLSAPPPGPAVTDRNMLADLSGAFSLAPQPLRSALCGNPAVSVFVQNCPARSTACAVRSWGYRRHGDPAPFIALSAGLWPGGGHAIAYPEFEREVINNLVGDLGQTFAASNSTPQMTVLAVLAHEMGHILAFRKQVLNQPCRNVLPPVQQIFWKNGWGNAADPGHFHQFGLQIRGDQRLRGPDKDHVNGSAAVLGQIYGIKPLAMPPQKISDWASLLANVAPDEDVIETYKLLILRTANNVDGGPLTSLKITIPGVGSATIIPDQLTDPNGLLIKKANWVQNCFL